MAEQKKRKAFIASQEDVCECCVCGQEISAAKSHYFAWGKVGTQTVRMHCDCANPTVEPTNEEWQVGRNPGQGQGQGKPVEEKGESLADAIAKGKGQGQGEGQGEGNGGGEDKPVMWSEFSPAIKLIDDELTKVNKRVDKAGSEFKNVSSDLKSLRDDIKNLKIAGNVTQVEIVDRDKNVVKNLDTVHFIFPQVLAYVQEGVHVYLHGEKGGGKSTLAKQVADALGLNYGYISLNALSSASLLTGFMSASGQFVSTEFRRIYENGGVFCIDELDNAAANVLTAINGAIANEVAAFADCNVPMHKDFILIGTGNTPLRGATPEYPERRKGDESVMDRLAFIEMPYDKALERKLALQRNENSGAWVDWVQNVRAFAAKADSGIRGLFATPRAVIFGAQLLNNPDIKIEAIADSSVFKGINPSMKDKILKEYPLPKAGDVRGKKQLKVVKEA